MSASVRDLKQKQKQKQKQEQEQERWQVARIPTQRVHGDASASAPCSSSWTDTRANRDATPFQ
jgi:hypothetical protein